MKTQYYTASSLDGFIAAPGHNLDWLLQFGEPEGGGSYPSFIRDVGALAMGSSTYEWVLRHLVAGEGSAPESTHPAPQGPDEGSGATTIRKDEQYLNSGNIEPEMPAKGKDPDALPAPAEGPQPWPYIQPTWVFSSRDLAPPPPGPSGASGRETPDIRFVRGDVRPVHRAMVEAAGGKNIWIVGGGDLVGQFYDAGLLDELIVQVTSVTLGAGSPLLPRAIVTPPLRLTSVQQWGESFVELRYLVGR